MDDLGEVRLGRRRFLGLGAGILGGALLPREGLAAGLLGAPSPEAPVLWVGFHPGGDGAWSVAAPRAWQGADPVRVVVHGLYQPEAWPELRALRLTALFQGRRDRSFHAWSYKDARVPSHAGRSSFVYPPGATGGLHLEVSVDLADEANDTRAFDLPLALGLDGGPGLGAGFYALAPAPAGTRAPPRWGRCRWRPPALPEQGPGGLVREAATGTTPAPFPYLLVEIRPEADEGKVA